MHRPNALLLVLAFVATSCGPITDARPASAISAHGTALAASPAQAPGDLDPTFGAGGKVTTDFFRAKDAALSLALQPDGKLVVGGVATNSATENDFALARYNPDGSLDASFGTSGVVTTDFFGNIPRELGASLTDLALKVLLQPDGKIVLSGWAFETATGFHFALARYNADGSLDATFGTDGKVVSNFPGKFEGALSAALQPDGKIVLAGTNGTPVGLGLASDIDFGVARYNGDGSLDMAFGVSGFVRTDFLGNIDEARSVVIQADGKIVVAGFANHPTGHKFSAFALARYNSNGSLDAGFGVDGKVTTDFFEGDDIASSLTLQPDGKIIAVGEAFNPATGTVDWALARYKVDGSLDATFGAGGLVTTDFFGGLDRARGVSLQSDGTILVVGTATNLATGRDFALARYNSDGSLHTTFGKDGKVTTDFFEGDDVAASLALRPDGKIVVAGFATSLVTDLDFALARYLGDR